MAKKIADEDMVLNIIINGDKGRAELNKLEGAVKNLSIANEGLAARKAKVEREMAKLEAAGKKDSDIYNNLTTEVRQLSSEMERNQNAIDQAKQRMTSLRGGLDLTKMTVTDLRSEIARLTKLRNTSTPGTEQWKAYDKQLSVVARRYGELKNEGEKTKGALCRMADGINKYWNMVVSGLASLTGIFLSIKGAVSKFVEFEDILSDTQKTTGLTKQEVQELNETLKQIDTRTAQEELQGLARIGGKLGIEGKENLEGFVRAADQINVALKEDLGGDTEEAIRQVGKLVDIFKVKDDFGIEQGLLKVGSVINELGAASTANEGFIVEFSKRVAGVAPSAGISVDAVMGLAATLDQFGQQAEASSTVYSQMMAKMFKNTAAYANIAGMSLTEFSDMMNRDANEAFIRVLEGLKGNNEGMEALVKNLGDMQLNGVRATTILGTLANHTTTLREQQKLANEAFLEGTSLTNEFNIKNNNAVALAEKQKKVRNDLIRDLGQKLQPIMVKSNNTMNTGLQILNTLVGFLVKYGSTLVTVSVLIATYVAGTKLQVLWTTRLKDALDKKIVRQKLDTILMAAQTAAIHLLTAAKALLTGNIKAATIAFKAFSTAVKMNPLGLLLTAIVAVGVGIYKLCTYMSDSEKAMQRMKAVTAEFEKEAALEEMTLQRLFGTLRKSKEGTEEWEKARKVIMDKYAPYLSNLGIEIKTLADAEKAYLALSLAIRETAMEKAKEQASQDAAKNLVDTEVEQMRKIKEAIDETYEDSPEKAARYFKQMKAELDKGGTMSKNMSTVMFNAGIEKNIVKLQKAKDAYKKEMKEINAIFSVPDKKTASKVSGGSVVEGGKKSVVDSSDQFKSPDYDAQIIALKESYARQKITKEKYEKQLDQLELLSLQNQLKNFEGTEEKRLTLQQKIADKRVAIREKQDKEEKTKSKDKSKDYIDALLADNNTAIQKEELAYKERLDKADLYNKDKSKMNEKEQKALEVLEKQHQDNLRKIEENARKKESDDYMKGITARIKQMETAHKIEAGQKKSEYFDNLDKTDSPGQRKKLSTAFGKDMMDLTEKQAGEMADLLNELLVQMDIDSDLDLGDVMLSPEQKEQVMARLNEVKEKINELKEISDYAKAENYGVDILGMDAGQWEVFFQHLGDGKLGIEDMQIAIAGVTAAWSTYDKLKTAQEKKQLKQYEQNTKKEKAALDKQLESGQISQEQYNARSSQLDADLDAKKEAIEKKQAERAKRMAIFETIINLAAGIVKLWVNPAFPAAIPMTAVLGALGAAQIATIAAAQYAQGKYPVIGEDDGRTYQADYAGDNLQTGIYQKPTLGLFSEKEPEMVVDGATTRKLVFNYPQIYQNIMDVSRGRTPQFAEGRYPVSTTDVSTADITTSTADPEMKQLLKANLAMMEALKNKNLEIPWYGQGGIAEKMGKAQKYEQKTTVKP